MSGVELGSGDGRFGHQSCQDSDLESEDSKDSDKILWSWTVFHADDLFVGQLVSFRKEYMTRYMSNRV